MIKLFKKNFLKFFKRKMKLNDELKRQKINFVFRFLLANYELKLRGKIDLPAFYYAKEDMERIIKENKVNCAYKMARKIVFNY